MLSWGASQISLAPSGGVCLVRLLLSGGRKLPWHLSAERHTPSLFNGGKLLLHLEKPSSSVLLKLRWADKLSGDFFEIQIDLTACESQSDFRTAYKHWHATAVQGKFLKFWSFLKKIFRIPWESKPLKFQNKNRPSVASGSEVIKMGLFI